MNHCFKKPNWKCFFLAAFCTLAWTVTLPSSKAQEGAEGHGGQTMSKDGEQWLRDLLDSASCHWMSGDRFAQKYAPGFAEIQSRLEQTDWYFSQSLAKELTSLQICMNRVGLKPVPEKDLDLFLPYEAAGNQVAVRIHQVGKKRDTVFIDANLFEQMPENQRPFLLLHESIHGFIPSNTALRSLKVRSFVFSIHKQEHWPMAKENFDFLIEASGICLLDLNKAFLDEIQKKDLVTAKRIFDHHLNQEQQEKALLDLLRPEWSSYFKEFAKKSTLNQEPLSSVTAYLFHSASLNNYYEIRTKNFGLLALIQIIALIHRQDYSERAMEPLVHMLLEIEPFDANAICEFRTGNKDNRTTRFFNILNIAILGSLPRITKALLEKSNANPCLIDDTGSTAKYHFDDYFTDGSASTSKGWEDVEKLIREKTCPPSKQSSTAVPPPTPQKTSRPSRGLRD